MRPLLTALLTASWLFAGQAFAAGDGGAQSSPFADKKVPEVGTDPGFDLAAKFFSLFATGRTLFKPDSPSNDLGGVAFSATHLIDTRDYSHYEVYRNRPQQKDPGADKKYYSAISRIIAEYQAELKLDSPKAVKNLGPADDPDALPGLDY